MKLTLSLLAAIGGMTLAQAGSILASWDTFTAGGASTTGNLTVDLVKQSPGGSIENGSLILSPNTERAWVDISSLNMNLRTGSYSFEMDVTGLKLNNGPIFSLTSGNYNTQTAAFGFSNQGNLWAFSNNGNNMSVKGSAGSMSTTYSGKLTVNFLTENGQNYVEAFLDDATLVSKTAITYSSAASANNNLTGLTLGGWGSTSGNGSELTINSLIISQIPEPATASLGLLGLAALCMRRRRA